MEVLVDWIIFMAPVVVLAISIDLAFSLDDSSGVLRAAWAGIRAWLSRKKKPPEP